MTMQPSRVSGSGVSGSDTLAEVLREHSPAPDELARARMEKRLVLAAHAPRAPRRSRAPRVALVTGGAIAVAAAIGLAVLAASDEPAPPIARFERREASASVERGTLEEGSSLRTDADEVAEIQVADSEVRIGGASRVRIAGLARDRIALELDEGTVEVAFHPRERSSGDERERMTVETPDARVEVVGTVFRVTASGGATEVSVSEGTVRVVPLGGGEPRLVHAGDSTRVTRSLARAAEPEPVALSEDEVIEDEVVEDEVVEDAVIEDEVIEDEGAVIEEPAPEIVREAAAVLTPAEQLADAQRLIHRGRAPAALRPLRELTRPSVPADVRVEAWTVIGEVHTRAGRLGEAARAYESAARDGRGTQAGQNAIFALARLQHRHLGDPEAARASYQRYLDEAPTGALASQARRALCSLGATEHCEARP